jgi:small subunit ribosomal protein S3Ae
MAKKRKRVVDKWKLKKWYTIIAPSMFDNKVLGETPASDPELVVNRVIEVPFIELSGQRTQSAIFTMVKFRVKEVKGEQAYTELIGHEMANAYVRTLVRRRTSSVFVVKKITTKDGKEVVLKVLAVTDSKVPSNTRTNIYHAIVEELDKINSNYEQLMKDVLYGNISAQLMNRLKNITAMRKVEIKKSELREQF